MKKRFTIKSFGINGQSVLFDNETQKTILTVTKYSYYVRCLQHLLNKQDMEIKELEEKNQRLKTLLDKVVNDCNNLFAKNEQLKHLIDEKERAIKMLKGIKRYDIGELLTENAKLKQSQNQKAIEVLKQAKIEFETYYADNIWNYSEWIDSQIAELRG